MAGDRNWAGSQPIYRREYPAKYMESRAISGTNRQTKEFCADGLVSVGYEADAKETRLQIGHNRIQEVFHGVELKSTPARKRVGIGERLAVKQAGLAASETPFIGLVEVIPFQHHPFDNNRGFYSRSYFSRSASDINA